MTENELSSVIVNCCYQVHKTLGPGLLESIYVKCLSHELRVSGLNFECEKKLVVHYKGTPIDCDYRLDMIVENKVIVEVKAVEATNNLHLAQVLTYLKVTGAKLALLVNFNVPLIKSGVRRVANGLLSQ
jgi:GxxExxY protein